MQHIGKTANIEVNGKTYTLSRFTREVLSRFLDWAEKKLPNPLDMIRDKLHGFPPELQEIMVREAISSARLKRSIHSPEVNALMNTPEGVMKVIHLLFAKFHPELTDKDVERIYDECAEEHGAEYLGTKIGEASGVMPDKEKGQEEPEGEAKKKPTA